MTHGTDRRIEAKVYIGICFCPNCGAAGSIFEIYRKNPSGPWRLKEYRVLHTRQSHNDVCLNLHGGIRTYCRIPQRDGWQFNGSNSMFGGGWMKRSMIRNNETSLEDAWRREVAPLRGTGFILDEEGMKSDLMPRGYR
jgi:hypothetical protein